MDNGWIKLYRSILDWPLFWNGNSPTQLWIYILLSANHKDRRSEKRLVKRGQLLTSYRKLMSISGWSQHTIEKFLRSLKEDEVINYVSENKKGTGGTLITIRNYNKYQAFIEEDIANNATPSATQCATDSATQTATIQECKELKNTLLPPRAREESIDKVKILKGYLADDDFIFGKSEEVMMPYERVKDCISMFLSQIQNNPDTDDSTSETELQRHMTNWMRNNKRINQSSKNKNNGSTKPTISFAERIEQLRQQTQAELDELGTITAH